MLIRGLCKPFFSRVGMLVTASALVLASLTPALAEERLVPVKIIAVSGAPVGLSRCKAHMWNSSLAPNVTFTNLSGRYLQSVTIAFKLYNHLGELAGDGDVQVDASVMPGDSVNRAFGDSHVFSSDGGDAVAAVTCRLQSASFEGHKTWKYGQKWPEKLAPAPAVVPSTDEVGMGGRGDAVGDNPGSTRRAPAPADLVVAVVNSWNDTVGNNLLVHTALDVTGGVTDATLSPNMLSLTMTLANGGKKAYRALGDAAPTYKKINPMGDAPMVAYEVDPKDDLGRLGSLIVPARGKVRVVATFLVGTDNVANPTDNRSVAVK